MIQQRAARAREEALLPREEKEKETVVEVQKAQTDATGEVFEANIITCYTMISLHLKRCE
jgi:hypothetical protein